MAEQFLESIVEQAWTRSGGYCECEEAGHGHIGKHNKMVLKNCRGDRDSEYGWEAHSLSTLHLDTPDDCKIYCWSPCHKATLS